MPAQTGQTAPFQPISFWAPPEVRAELQAAAIRDGRNLSQWVRVVVMRELARSREAATGSTAAAEGASQGDARIYR
jgi:hypothetical protein